MTSKSKPNKIERRLNALKTGAYSQEQFLPFESREELEAAQAAYLDELQPSGKISEDLALAYVRNRQLARRVAQTLNVFVENHPVGRALARLQKDHSGSVKAASQKILDMPYDQLEAISEFVEKHCEDSQIDKATAQKIHDGVERVKKYSISRSTFSLALATWHSVNNAVSRNSIGRGRKY